MKIDILAFGAHPDDIELSCCGTLIKHMEAGYTVGIIDLTQGELGSRGSGELRLIEAENSRKIMGDVVRENLGLPDGFFSHNKENLLAVAKVIRKYKPEIVLANSINDRHQDHGKGAKLVSDACFHSGLVKIDIDGLEPWRPRAVYHYIQDKNLEPDFVVDITPYMDKKLECIQAFNSQFYTETEEDKSWPSTPISSKNFFEYIKAKDKTNARSIRVDFAEAFNVGRSPGVRNLFDLL